MKKYIGKLSIMCSSLTDSWNGELGYILCRKDTNPIYPLNLMCVLNITGVKKKMTVAHFSYIPKASKAEQYNSQKTDSKVGIIL